MGTRQPTTSDKCAVREEVTQEKDLADCHSSFSRKPGLENNNACRAHHHLVFSALLLGVDYPHVQHLRSFVSLRARFRCPLIACWDLLWLVSQRIQNKHRTHALLPSR